MPCRQKKKEPEYTSVVAAIDDYDVETRASINNYMDAAFREFVDDEDPVFTFETDLTIRATCIEPTARKGHAIELTLLAPAHLSRRLRYRIKQFAARKLQRDIWQRRRELWPDSVPSDPAKLLDPEVAFRLIGFQYELAETLGQYSNESGTFEVAGIIDRPSRRVQNSRQLPFETRAFTAAHELGHALLHEGMRMHRDRPLDGSQQDRGRRDRTEYEADKFASFFLMPETLLRNRFRQLFLCKRFGIDEATAFALDPADKHRLLSGKKSLRDLSRILARAASYNGRQFPPLAKQFNVSVEAMAIRLEELDLLDV